MNPGRKKIFMSGGTGYIGRRLTAELLALAHEVRVLARPESAGKVQPGARVIPGDPFSPSSFAAAVAGCDTYVHLLGTPKPAPWKGAEFRRIDAASLRASVEAARRAGVVHFVYVSVAHPAPVMRDYIAVRQECEEYIQSSGLSATILRPWYVLGPGHRWPRLLLPLYAGAKWIPAWRQTAERLSLVTLEELVAALRWAIEHPAKRQIWTVPDIRAGLPLTDY